MGCHNYVYIMKQLGIFLVTTFYNSICTRTPILALPPLLNQKLLIFSLLYTAFGANIITIWDNHFHSDTERS